jgi:hypothetical protein
MAVVLIACWVWPVDDLPHLPHIPDLSREGGRARRAGRRRRAIVASALFGSAFVAFAVNSAVDGRWRDARDVGLLGLLFGAPAIVMAVKVWLEP